MMLVKRKRKTPYLTIIFSFLLVIIAGSFLLWLPWSSNDSAEPISFVDAFFTATSSVCVTGLSTVPSVAGQFSIFGRIIMMILIEIGGLSFLTFAVFLIILLGAKLSIADRFLMREALNQNSVTGIVRLVKSIVILALSIQFIGVIAYTIIFSKYFPFWEALGQATFHSVSSFNNAGFDLLGQTSLIAYTNDFWLNFVTMVMIVVGGLGFIVLIDIGKKRRWKKLSLHTKIVLPTTLALIVVGAILLKLTMMDEINWLQAFFQSVTARTAGFATIDMATLNDPATIVMCLLMIVGASPCSTGGGLKTTTFLVIILAISSFARGKKPHVFERRISEQSVFRAFALFVLAIIFILVILFLLTIIEPFGIKMLLFETISAFGTVGLSMGITTQLHAASKLLLCLTMFFGRLGPLTIVSLWNSNWVQERDNDIRYIEEKIIIG